MSIWGLRVNQVEQQFHHKRVLVFGLGLQGGGTGDAAWLSQHGATVRVTDKKSEVELAPSLGRLPANIELTLGTHKLSDIDWADIIIKNPGVADDQEHILYAKKLGKPVYTSIALVVQALRDKVIGVTGTRGKSTTTTMIYNILSTAYPGEVKIGGNLPGTTSLALLDGSDSLRYLVLELSSFQLHNFHELKISPHLAVLTNIYPDHLNRYPSMEAYIADKEAIFRYQLPGDIYLNPASRPALPSEWTLKVKGAHNRDNAAIALSTSRTLGINDSISKHVLESFAGLPYRLETVAVVGGITYINDSTASTPIAAQRALEAMTRPTHLIVGGASKNLPFTDYLNTLSNSRNLKSVTILGSRGIPEFVEALRAVLADKILGQVDSMDAALTLASSSAKGGEVVLLSPGFTSFDLFPNEFERARQFTDWVQKLPQ